jgi:hypothetical protein
MIWMSSDTGGGFREMMLAQANTGGHLPEKFEVRNDEGVVGQHDFATAAAHRQTMALIHLPGEMDLRIPHGFLICRSS